MKKFSQIIDEARKDKLEIQDDTINYISAADLRKYLEIAGKFISDDSKEIVNWLIVNNSNYIKDLGVGGTSDNALADFYNCGPYKEEHKKELYKLIGKVAKSDRLLEIPVFQTEEQFTGILDGSIAPDEVIIDLTSEAGRNAVAKKYTPLCHKLARQFSYLNMPYDDIFASAYEGLVYAMNSYGKKSNKQLKREEESGDVIDIKKYKKMTFLSYAANVILNVLRDKFKNELNLVRIPASALAAERKEKGHNTVQKRLSGDAPINREEGGKTLFDIVGGSENAGTAVDNSDIDKYLDLLLKAIKKHPKITDKMVDVWVRANGLFGADKAKSKDIAKELGVANSSITYYCSVINNVIKNDPKVQKIAKELIVLYNESIQRSYENDGEEPIHLKTNNNNNNDTDMFND